MVTRTDGPFDYWEVTGDAVRSAAEAPGSDADVIQSLAGELEGDEKAAADAIEGDIEAGVTANTTAAKDAAQSLAAKGQYAVGLLKQFATDVDTFDTTVNQINLDYQGQLQANISTAQTDAREKATGDDDPEPVDTGAIAASVKAGLMPRYQKAEGIIDDAADTIASMFKQGPTDENVRQLVRSGLIPLTAATLYPTLTLTTDDRASFYKNAMAGLDAPARAKYLLDHKDIPADVLDTILKHDRDAADAIADVVDDKASKIDHDSSEDDVKEVVDLLNRFKDSGEASAAIVHKMGAQGLLATISIAGSRMYGGGDESDLELAQAVRDVFRKGEPVLADQDPTASRDLARDMVNFLKDPDRDSEQPGNDQYSLSYLLRDSTLSTPFLDTMGDELEHMERDGGDDFSWRSKGGMTYGGPWMFDEDDRDAAFDPVASYMSALGNNDEASLEFFTGGGGETPYDHDGEDRQDYWLGHRYWGHDNFDGVVSALDSATTGANNLDDPTSSREAAELMSNGVHLLAGRESVEWNGVDGEEFGPGDLTGDGTKHMAHMLSTYLPAIDRALENPEDPDGFEPGLTTLTAGRFGDGLEDMPLFLKDDLSRLTDVAVSDDEGFDTMRHGLSLYQDSQLRNSIDQHGSVDDETSQADARLEGFFVNSVGDTKIADAEDQDKRVQAWIDMGKDLVGEVPVPGGKITEFLASHALDAGADSLSEQYANSEGETVGDENDYASAALGARKHSIMEALVDAHVITADDVSKELTSASDSYSSEQINTWLEDGKYPGPDADLSDQDRRSLDDAILTVMGDRKLLDSTNYDQTYKDEFHKYFDKGDGDGN